jgi:hypothetical protein
MPSINELQDATGKELAELTKTVGQVSPGYQVIRGRFLDTYKRDLIPFSLRIWPPRMRMLFVIYTDSDDRDDTAVYI